MASNQSISQVFGRVSFHNNFSGCATGYLVSGGSLPDRKLIVHQAGLGRQYAEKPFHTSMIDPNNDAT